MIAGYDKLMFNPTAAEYYGGTDYHNFGYWDLDTENQGQASENLVRKLLEPISKKQGRILDVACGLGASTRYLQGLYGPENIIAINISHSQLNHAKEHVPDVQFIEMDAAHLAFEDSSFDAVLCVEAAFHFDSRDLFLHEAFRILRPGGWLVFSDILGPMPMKGHAERAHTPRTNYLADGDALQKRIQRGGFQSVRVTDTTAQCWQGFRDYMRRLPVERRHAGKTGIRQYVGETLTAWGVSVAFGLTVKHYYLCAAQRLSGDSWRRHRESTTVAPPSDGVPL
jgi:MPBQ/MSBQ methyltransferase